MYDKIVSWLDQYPALEFLGILIIAVLLYFLTKKIINESIKKIVTKTKNIYDDILINDRLLRRFSYIAPTLFVSQFTDLLPEWDAFLTNVIEALIVLQLLLSMTAIFNAFNDIYESLERHKDRPIKGYLQVVQIVIYILGIILIIGLLTDQDPWTLLGGIGAISAVALLVFKDTILGFVASIQITSYDLVKVGDWIEVPSYGVDGDVMDIALHTIKVRNFDKTITVIPTHKLIEVSFKNWRGMTETGGRRIKRPIYIDLSSVKFCDEEMLKKFEKFTLIKDYVLSRQNEVKEYNEINNLDTTEVTNGRRLTNLGTFREYLKAYLKSREEIRKDLTFLIRQLQPGSHGLPIEIYIFTNTTDWVPYEEIQSNIFDHIFAVVKEFDLAIYQNPTGNDFKNLK